MDRPWKREELEKMSIEELRNILKNRGQVSSGYKAKLIEKILGNKPVKVARKPKIEIKQEAPIANIPRDVLLITLYGLDYDSVVRTCRTSKQLNRVCEDERFWQEYAKRNNLKKFDPNDTWKITAQKASKELSSFATPIRGKILGAVHWILTEDPNKGLTFDTSHGSNFGGDEDYPLSDKQYNEIIFRGPVKVSIPYLTNEESEDERAKMIVTESFGKFKEGDEVYVEEPWADEDQYIIEIKPNTKYGSTLRHVIDSIYRGIWGLPKNEKRQLSDLIDDIYIPHAYFEGLGLPQKEEDFYTLSAGN